jgi:hypothetical protein
MDSWARFAKDHAPSTGEYDPSMHALLDACSSNVLAFFDLPDRPAIDRVRNTPEWVQHIALEVADPDALTATNRCMPVAPSVVSRPWDGVSHDRKSL